MIDVAHIWCFCEIGGYSEQWGGVGNLCFLPIPEGRYNLVPRFFLLLSLRGDG